MTEEQKKLCEDNHGLIYKFLSQRKLPADEFYDIAAIGLCKAAELYNGEWKFSTIAYKCMFNEIGHVFITQNRQKRTTDDRIIYLDAVAYDETATSFESIIGDNSSVEEIAISGAMTEFIYKYFNSNEKTIIKMLLDGYSQREISEKLGMSQQNISLIKVRLRKKLKNVGVIA